MAKQKPSIHQLVNGGIIEVGQTFFTTWNKFPYTGKVVDGEHIKISYSGKNSDPKNIENRLFESFNEPAKEICGFDVNAWLFWKQNSKSNKNRPINDWRKEWLAKCKQ